MRVIVDLSGIAYRAAHKMHLTAGGGVPTHVIYGTLRTLESLCATMQPEELIIAWDMGKEARLRLYPEYKAQRKRDEDFDRDFKAQMQSLKGILDCLPVVQVGCPGVEADDVIAALCGFLKHEQVGIVTADRDLFQLVTDNCKVYDHRGVAHKMEFRRPAHYLTYKALVGDTSDNIKGVLGVGDKTARALITKHKTLKRILRHAKQTGEPLGRMTYQEALPIVKRNLQLMKLDGRILTEDQRAGILTQYKERRLHRSTNKAGLQQLFEKLAFGGTLKRIDSFIYAFRNLERTKDGKPAVPARKRSGVVEAAKRRNAQSISKTYQSKQISDIGQLRRNKALQILSVLKRDKNWVRKQDTNALKFLKKVIRRLSKDEAYTPSAGVVKFLEDLHYEYGMEMPDWMMTDAERRQQQCTSRSTPSRRDDSCSLSGTQETRPDRGRICPTSG